MGKRISRRDFCKCTSLATMGLALGTGCDKRTLIPDTRDLKAPENLQAREGNGLIRLTWSPLMDPRFDHYNIYREDRTGILASCSGTTYIDPDVASGIQYQYLVSAVDTDGRESPSSTVTIMPTFVSSPLTKVASDQATSGMTVDYTTVKSMVSAGLCQFTGENDLGLALQSLFAGITVNSKIGLKVNTLTGLTTHPEVAYAVAEGLLSMFNHTFPLANITIFDYDKPANNVLVKAGYTNPGQFNSALQGLKIVGEVLSGFTGPAIRVTDTTQNLSPSLMASDYIINLPVLKDHSNAGITFSLKNYYGCINHPEALHDDHGNLYCDPAIPQLCSNDYIKSRQKLVVGDALFVVPSGGPESSGVTYAPNSIMIGTDPVAADFLALDLVNAERERLRSALISTTQVVGSHKPAAYLVSAASAPYALGNKNSQVTEITV